MDVLLLFLCAGGDVGGGTHTQHPLRYSGRGHGDGEEGGNEAGGSPQATEDQPEDSLLTYEQQQQPSANFQATHTHARVHYDCHSI